MCLHPSGSLNSEKKNCREISEDKIAVCEKTSGLRSGSGFGFSVFESVSYLKNISVQRYAQ